MSAATPYVMSDREIAWGYVPGHVDDAAGIDGAAAGEPRRVLEEVVVEALRRPPCGVAFSGGLDSSTVLAVATHVARREGLPEPIPITKRFPLAPDTSEDSWQEMVIRHLGLTNWERVTIHAELDLVGPRAERHLRTHGVIWPPVIHSDLPTLERVRGGSLLDGEGGDDVLGVETHRIAPLTELIMYPRLLGRTRARRTLVALAPRAARRPVIRRRLIDQAAPWLRPTARDALVDSLLDVELTRPLRFASSLRDVPRRRSQSLLARNRAILARDHAVTVTSPLLDPRVIASLAATGGWLGPGGRSTTLRMLVPDLLPDPLLERRTKASFNDAYMSTHSEEFVARWTGRGVDDDLVDAEALLRTWRDGSKSARTFALLQSAWLAEHTAAAVPGTSTGPGRNSV